MEKERLRLLSIDMENHIKNIDDIYDKIIQRNEIFGESIYIRESLAYQIHNLYCAFEDMMEFIANEFENQISETPNWHTVLLNRMKSDIKEIRPALISSESYLLLDELRGFRHWFRHAYSNEIDPERLIIVVNKALKLRTKYKDDVESFLQALSD